MTKYLDPGIHPFWFWNAPLNEDIIAQQLEQMAAAGCRGVFIHPRQGMEVPYLSPRFFKLIKAAIRHCVRLGLQPHLYDEFPYPAGAAGGLVTLGHPEFQATKLQHWRQEFEGTQVSVSLPRGAILDCKAIPLCDGQYQWADAIDLGPDIAVQYTNESHFSGGLSLYTEQRYFAHDPEPVLETTLPAGKYILCASIQIHEQQHKYWNNYVDVCNPEAMQEFMRYTQKRYEAALGTEYLQHVVAWFVDEIHPSWSRLLPQRYADKYTEPMDNVYVALQCSEHPRHEEIKERFRRLCYNAFCEAFEKPVSQWCKEHDLLYVVEKPQLYIEQLSFADVPGCDSGHRRAGVQHDLLRADLRYNARATGSAAQVYHKQAALCEGFHSLGWSATLEDLRLLSDNLILHGIDRITPHAFFASTHGLRKHDAPPSFFQQQANWPLFTYLSRRIAGIHARLGRLRHAADAVLIDPAAHLDAQQKNEYEKFLHQLTASDCEYLIIDASLLSTQDLASGQLHIAGLAIQKIICYGEQSYRAYQAHLDVFKHAGGAVYHNEIPEITRPGFRVQESAEKILQTQRARFVTDNGMVQFFINNGTEAVRVFIPENFQILFIDESYPEILPQPDAEGCVSLAAFASLLCLESVAGEQKTERQLTGVRPSTQLILNGEGQWRVERDRSNLLRLQHWHLKVYQGEQFCGEGDCVPQTISNHIAEAHISLNFSRLARFGQSACWSMPALHAIYEIKFQVQGQCVDIEFVFEDSSFRGQAWVLKINRTCFTEKDVRSSQRFGLGTSAIDITSALQDGENNVYLEIACQREDDGLLAACFISGEFTCLYSAFGLESTRDEVQMMQDLSVNDMTSIGCHYFDGVLTYSGEIMLELSGTESWVDIDCSILEGEAFEIQINESKWYPVLWAPRCVRVPRAVLRQGSNHCELRRYGSLGPAYDGELFDFKQHQRLPMVHD